MATMDGCVFALMEISKQKPAMSKNLPTPKILDPNELRMNNQGCVTEIAFELDPPMQKNIIHAKSKLSENMEKLYMELKYFNNYGKATIKEMKVHPDTFMQIAIQVAGYKTTGRLAQIFLLNNQSPRFYIHVYYIFEYLNFLKYD